MNPAAPVSVFDRLSADILGLRDAVVRRSVQAGQSVALVIEAWQMLRRLDARLASVVARYRAGKLFTRLRKPRAPKPGDASPTSPPLRPKRLPRGFGWFAKLIRPDAFHLADQLSAAIIDPEMVQVIAAGPQAGRILRTMCRMLGTHAPSIARPKRPPTARVMAQAAEVAARKAARAAAKAARKPGKRMRWRDIVPPGHSYPRTEEGWAEWIKRYKRAERRRRAAKWKSA